MLRTTLKGLLARKLRLSLSAFAIVLSVMFVGGTFVFTDALNRSMDAALDQMRVDSKVIVTGVQRTDGTLGPDTVIGADTVDRVQAVPGVAYAYGRVETWRGFTALGDDGRSLANASGLSVGNWPARDTSKTISQGRVPIAATEAAVNVGLAKAAGFGLGDTVTVRGSDRARYRYTIVGIFTCRDGDDSYNGEFDVVLSEPEAQRLVRGASGSYDSVLVETAGGHRADPVAAAIRAALGDGYRVATGEQVAGEQVEQFRDELGVVRNILLGFAALALLVGVFLILNTFSIVVAQRTGELALLRALGASARQIRRSVLVEAGVVGLVGSALGLLAGLGLGRLGAWLLMRGSGSIHLAGVGVPVTAIAVSFTTGITATVAAAAIPAHRASRVAPLAAMRIAADGQRPLTRISVAGAVVCLAGIASLGTGMVRGRDDTATYVLMLAGILTVLIGVALLAPLVSRPVCSAIGRLFAWSVAGRLGRRNAVRAPRRTAATASAIMLGVAVVALLSTVAASAKAAMAEQYRRQIHADLVITVDESSGTTLAPQTISVVRGLPGVRSVVGVGRFQARIDGEPSMLTSIDDLGAAAAALGIQRHAGTVGSLRPGQVIADRYTAADLGLEVGDTVRIHMDRGGARQYTLVGTTEENQVVTGFVVALADLEAGFAATGARQAYVTVADDVVVRDVKRDIEAVLAADADVDGGTDGGVAVATRQAYLGEVTGGLDDLLAIVQVLLVLAMVIAVLGVVNTLVLSVIERTRELGVLRAIGLRRGQLSRMVTVESMVVSLFGAVLGLAVGCALGAAVVGVLNVSADGARAPLALPWELMGWYLVGALVAGVVAAAAPALRAARLDVLAALAD